MATLFIELSSSEYNGPIRVRFSQQLAIEFSHAWSTVSGKIPLYAMNEESFANSCTEGSESSLYLESFNLLSPALAEQDNDTQRNNISINNLSVKILSVLLFVSIIPTPSYILFKLYGD